MSIPEDDVPALVRRYSLVPATEDRDGSVAIFDGDRHANAEVFTGPDAMERANRRYREILGLGDDGEVTA